MEIQPIYSSMESHAYLNRIEKYVARKAICEADAELIRRYVSYKMAIDSISAKRTLKITGTLLLWRTKFLNCNFTEITDELWLTSAGLIRSAEFRQNSARDYLLIGRGFLSWMQEQGINRNLTPAGVMKVKLIPVQKITKTPDQLLSDDEVSAMLHHPQCRPVTAALIAILYYTGMRPSEALSLRWRDLEFASQLLKIRISDTKTGKFRYAPCSEALEYVAYWRNHYPDEIPGGPEGDNAVFVCRTCRRSLPGKPYASMSYNSAKKQIVRISSAAIGRAINPYIFRSSDITNSAVKGVPDSVNKAIHWGNQSTNMLSTYLLLKDSQIDTALLKRAGVAVKEDDVKQNVPILCSKCFTMNMPGSGYCRTCGEPLSKEAKQKDLQLHENSRNQQDQKDMENMIRDVAEVFGMTVQEFKEKMMKIKSL